MNPPPYNPNDPNQFQQPGFNPNLPPNPYQQNPYQQNPYQQNPYQQPPNPYQGNYIPPYNPFVHNGPVDLPNAQNAQICGIIGLILFWNIIGLVLNICAMSMGSSSIRESEITPGRYSEASISKAKAAKTCGIIGASLFGFALIVFVILLAANS